MFPNWLKPSTEYTAVPLIHGFTFHSVVPAVNCVQKYHMENSRNKQCTSFRLATVLTVTMDSSTVPLLPTRGWFVPSSSICRSPARQSFSSCLGYQTNGPGACIQVILILLTNGLQVQGQWCWQFARAKEKPWSVSFKWQGDSSQPNKERKKPYAVVAKIHRKNKSPAH